MQERDEDILRHLAVYKLSLRAVVERLFFEGKSCDDVLRRLMDEKLIAAAPLGRLKYYYLQPNGAQRIDIKFRGRKKPLGPRATPRDLAALWFCCMMDTPRFRIPRRNLVQLFGEDKNDQGFSIPHCWEWGTNKEKLITRIYVPGPTTKANEVADSVRRDGERVLADPRFRPYVLQRWFSFAVLVGDVGRKQHVEELLREQSPPLTVRVEAIPMGGDQLESAIRRQKAQTGC